MTRNSDDTRRRILDAALATLLSDGFAAFGVNAVARRAGCDKQLIYRYFDGLDGLVAALGARMADRLAAALAPAADPPSRSYAEFVARMLAALRAHLEGNDEWRILRAWEAGDPAAATAFRAARGRAMQAFVAQARGTLSPPPGRDAAAINAVLIAAAEGLALTGPVGLDPADAATPTRIAEAFSDICQCVADSLLTHPDPSGEKAEKKQKI